MKKKLTLIVLTFALIVTGILTVKWDMSRPGVGHERAALRPPAAAVISE